MPQLFEMMVRFLVPLRRMAGDQVLRDAAQAEAAGHQGGAVEEVGDRLVGAGDGLVHDENHNAVPCLPRCGDPPGDEILACDSACPS